MLLVYIFRGMSFLKTLIPTQQGSELGRSCYKLDKHTHLALGNTEEQQDKPRGQVGSWCLCSCHGGSWCQGLSSLLCWAAGAHSWPLTSSGCSSYLLKLTWASLAANTQLSSESSVALSHLLRLFPGWSWGECVGVSNVAVH